VPDDNERLLRQMAVDIAVIRTKIEEQEKLKIAERVATIERSYNYFVGGVMLINFALGAYVALRK
jgi:hypothetical protein